MTMMNRPEGGRPAWAIALLLFGVTLAGCRGGGAEEAATIAEQLPVLTAARLSEGQRLRVVASTSLIADVVAEVGGPELELSVLVPKGQDPHAYQPTPSAIATIERAHIVFVNGFGLEEGLLDTIASTAKGTVVPVSAGIVPLEPEHEGDHDDDHDHAADPHVWLDPTNVATWVANIELVLSTSDPAHRELYSGRAAAYADKIEALDVAIRERVAALPPDSRKLVTDHHLLHYFADEYGFEIVAAILPGTSTSLEVSPRQMADLVGLLKREGVSTIFVGSTAGRGVENIARALSAELGGTVRIVSILTGSLAEAGSPGDSYLSYVWYNADRIISELAR